MAVRLSLRRIAIALALMLSLGIVGATPLALATSTATLWSGNGANVNFFVQRASDASIRGTGFAPNATYTFSAPYGSFDRSPTLALTADANGDFGWIDFSLGTDVPFSVNKFFVSVSDQSGSVVATIEADVFPPQFDVGYCPGQPETVTGRGFPDGTYSITTSDSGVALSATSVTPADGVIRVGVIPAQLPPASVRMTLTSQADSTATWGATWYRASPYAGSITNQTWWSMQAHASCFIPGETVSVVTHDSTTSAPESVVADAHGTVAFEIDFNPAATPHESNYLTLTGAQSGQPVMVGGNIRVFGTQLHPGNAVDVGFELVSPKPGYVLYFPGGCNPWIERVNPDNSGSAGWDAGVTTQDDNCHMSISDSGNLAVYSGSGAVLWATHTRGTTTGNYATMRQDGNLALYSATNALLWLSNPVTYNPVTKTYAFGGPQAPPAGARLASGATLRRGHYIRNGNTRFELLDNGNLVVIRGVRTVWSSKTIGRAGVALTMQRNGNLVLRTATGRIVWTSGTANRGSSDQVIVGANGDVAIWSSAHHLIWHAGTGI